MIRASSTRVEDLASGAAKDILLNLNARNTKVKMDSSHPDNEAPASMEDRELILQGEFIFTNEEAKGDDQVFCAGISEFAYIHPTNSTISCRI